MRMETDRFKEYSGEKPRPCRCKNQNAESLEQIPSLLIYESTVQCECRIVKYGSLSNIKVVGKELTFRFVMKGQFPRGVVDEFADVLR